MSRSSKKPMQKPLGDAAGMSTPTIAEIDAAMTPAKVSPRMRKSRATTAATGLPNEPWASPEQIVAHTGLSLATIKRLVLAEKIPCVRIARRVLFKRSAVDAALVAFEAARAKTRDE